jgi:4-hydroxy-3-methylbut-2-enyl diphosphate reductase
VADNDCLVSAHEIRHKPVGVKSETTTRGWFPTAGPVAVGLTAGASTPDNSVGDAILKLESFAS